MQLATQPVALAFGMLQAAAEGNTCLQPRLDRNHDSFHTRVEMRLHLVRPGSNQTSRGAADFRPISSAKSAEYRVHVRLDCDFRDSHPSSQFGRAWAVTIAAWEFSEEARQLLWPRRKALQTVGDKALVLKLA